MKTKDQKRNEARKTAEANKAARKQQRTQKLSTMVNDGQKRKGKSTIPQSKTAKKK